MLFIACGLLGSSALADPCDDYAHAVDKYIQAIRQSGQKLDQATDAHQFADAVNAFTSATEELTATLRELSPQVTALSQSRSNASLPTCERAQERLVAFSAELDAVGTKLAEQAQKYISDPEVQQAFDRLRKLRFNASDRGGRLQGFRIALDTRDHSVEAVQCVPRRTISLSTRTTRLDVAPNGASRILWHDGYKDYAPTELGQGMVRRL
jgi:primosomal protein N''